MARKRIPVNITITNFKLGSITLLAESRMPIGAAKQAQNLFQTQDGLWTTRPGTTPYGQAIPGLSASGTIDGHAEYVKYNSDGTTTKELIVVANGVAQKSVDGGAWSTISGATYTIGKQCFFLQIKSRLYITNGTDPLSYYDGSVINTYTAIASVGVVTPTLNVLTTGSFNNYYQVVALNSVGYAIPSAQISQTTNKVRNSWSTAASEKITLSWSAVTGATRYDVYWGDTSGFLFYIGSTTTTSFVDDNTATPNTAISPPTDNTTAAPKFKQMELSGNRIWATGDDNNPYRVYFGGTGAYQGFFSPFYGGGYIDLELGGRNKPVAVIHYRDGRGNSLITVLCTDPEGNGTIWQVTLTTATVGTVTLIIPSGDKVVGSIGSSSPYGVVKAKDAVIFPNNKGFFRLGSIPQLLNLLSTDELSANIRPDHRSLVGSKISGICGYYFLGKLFYSVPTTNTGNSATWIYDMEHQNWQLGWSIGFSQFGEYTDSSGVSYFLAAPIKGNQLLQISENVLGDSGAAWTASYVSGLTPVAPDRRLFAKIKYAYVELYNPVGTVYFEVLGTEKKRGFAQQGQRTITDTVSQTGMSWEKLSSVKLSDSTGKPTQFSQSTVRKRIRINKLLNNVQFHVYSNDINTKFTILSLQAIGYIVSTRDPSRWTQ